MICIALELAVDVEVPVKNIANFGSRKIFRAAIVCLGFTGSGVGWADPPHTADYVEDPMAPHHTTGNTARLGTSVGFLYGDPANKDAGAATALGLTAAGGDGFTNSQTMAPMHTATIAQTPPMISLRRAFLARVAMARRVSPPGPAGSGTGSVWAVTTAQLGRPRG